MHYGCEEMLHQTSLFHSTDISFVCVCVCVCVCVWRKQDKIGAILKKESHKIAGDKKNPTKARKPSAVWI